MMSVRTMTLNIPAFHARTEAMMASLASRQYDWAAWLLEELRLEHWRLDAKNSPALLRKREIILAQVDRAGAERESLTLPLGLRASPSALVEKLLYGRPPYSFQKMSRGLRQLGHFEDKQFQELARLLRGQKDLRKSSAEILLLRSKRKDSQGNFAESVHAARFEIFSEGRRVFKGGSADLAKFFCR
jgi:hypothetical protein